MNNDTNKPQDQTSSGVGLPPLPPLPLIPSAPTTPPPPTTLPTSPAPAPAVLPEIKPSESAIPGLPSIPTQITTPPSPTGEPSPEKPKEGLKPKRKVNKKLVIGGAILAIFVAVLGVLAYNLPQFTAERRARADCPGGTVDACTASCISGCSGEYQQQCIDGCPGACQQICAGTLGYCGDGTCGGGTFDENSTSCPQDCATATEQPTQPPGISCTGSGYSCGPDNQCYSLGGAVCGTAPNQYCCNGVVDMSNCPGGCAGVSCTPGQYYWGGSSLGCRQCNSAGNGYVSGCVTSTNCGSQYANQGPSGCQAGGTVQPPSSYTCTQTAGQSCVEDEYNSCDDVGKDAGSGTCELGYMCCKPRGTPALGNCNSTTSSTQCQGAAVDSACTPAGSGTGYCQLNEVVAGDRRCLCTTGTPAATATATPRPDSCGTGSTCQTGWSTNRCLAEGGEPEQCTTSAGSQGTCCEPTAPGTGGVPGPTTCGANSNDCCDGKTPGSQSCQGVTGTCNAISTNTDNTYKCTFTYLGACTPNVCEAFGTGSRKCNSQGSGYSYFTDTNCGGGGGTTATCVAAGGDCSGGQTCCNTDGAVGVCQGNVGQEKCQLAPLDICGAGGSCTFWKSHQCTNLAVDESSSGVPVCNQDSVTHDTNKAQAEARAKATGCGQLDQVCSNDPGKLCGGFTIYDTNCGTPVTGTPPPGTGTPPPGTETPPPGENLACVNTRLFINGATTAATQEQMSAINIGDNIRMVVLGNSPSLVGARFLVKRGGADISSGGFQVTANLTPIRSDGVREFYYDFPITQAGSYEINGFVKSIPPTATATPVTTATATPVTTATATATIAVGSLPACSVTGEEFLTVGTNYTFTGNFSAPASLAGQIYRDNFVAITCDGTCRSGNTPPLYFDFPSTSGNHTWSWTPTAADIGTHTISCRTRHDAIKECRPGGTGTFADCGSNSTMSVTVSGSVASTCEVCKATKGTACPDVICPESSALGASTDRPWLELVRENVIKAFGRLFAK